MVKAVYARSGSDFARMRQLGFDTVIGHFTIEDLDKMQALGMGCVLGGEYKEHPAVIAYYLYDEPDVTGVPIAEQDAKIAEYRAKTSKPLAIAVIEEVERKCSLHFDWYMLDIYYSNKLSKLKNYLNIAISSHFIQILYKGKKVLPIMGLYDDRSPFVFSLEILPFARKFRSYFRDEKDQAIFIWQGDGVNTNGIINRPCYSYWALQLNTTTDRCWWITSKVLRLVAWTVLKVNPLLGKYKIQIGN